MNSQYSKILRAECVSTRKLTGLAIELSIDGNGVGMYFQFINRLFIVKITVRLWQEIKMCTK